MSGTPICKPSEVLFTEASYRPFASCEEDGCTWDSRFHNKSAKLAAKEHVAYSGHPVKVVTQTIGTYWAPEGSDG
jgi:hypothetical protein